MRKIVKVLFIVLISLSLFGCGGPKEVTDEEITVEYLNNSINGKYTGTFENKVPNGEGTFVYDDGDHKVTYSGNWIEGKMSGDGHVDDNKYSIFYFNEYDVIGDYSGEAVDGIPNGKGTFNGKNKYDVNFCYTGEFKKGNFNGHGHIDFDNDETYTQDGNYVNGNFTPTVREEFTALGTLDKYGDYVISDNANKFLDEHNDLFEKCPTEGFEELIDNEFKYEAFAKNYSRYGDKLIKVKLKIVQISERELWGRQATYFIGNDSNYNVYMVDINSYYDDIYEKDSVEVIGLPISYFTYPNVAGTDIWAIRLAGVTMSK